MGSIERILSTELQTVNILETPETPVRSKALVFTDNVCDYLPLVSALSNVVDLCFKKCLQNTDLAAVPVTDYTYYQWHLQEKSTLRCLILILLPGIGNFFFLVYDCINRRYNDEDFVISEVLQFRKSDHLKKASLRVRSIPRVVLAAITNKGEIPLLPSVPDHRGLIIGHRGRRETEHSAILSASPLLRRNLDFMRLACKTNGEVLQHADSNCKRDFVAVVHAVNHTPHIYGEADRSLREEESKEALELAEFALQYASNIKHTPVSIRSNRERALEAVKKDGFALSGLSQFQDDEEFANAAIEKCGSAYRFISDRLKETASFAEKALANECSLGDMPHFQDNKQMVRFAINLREVSEATSEQINASLRLSVLRNCQSLQIQHASLRLRDDENLMRFAAHPAQKGRPLIVYDCASSRLQQNKEFVKYLVSYDSSVYSKLPQHMKEDVDVAITLYEKYNVRRDTMRLIPQSVQNNATFIARKQEVDRRLSIQIT